MQNCIARIVDGGWKLQTIFRLKAILCVCGLQHCIAISILTTARDAERWSKFDIAIIIIVITKYLGMTSENLC